MTYLRAVTPAALCLLLAALPLDAQQPEPGSAVERYVSVAGPAIAVTGVTLIDGTGAPARAGQTVVISGNTIQAVGDDGSVPIPPEAEVLDGTGHTLIPGMIGLHDHLYYTAAGGRGATLTYSAPRLYLGSGVTSVRTTGSRAPYSELNMKAEIERGRWPGPRIHITAPYITGGSGISTMTLIESPEDARHFVRYWAEEGATWLKAYTNIGYDEFAAAIDEAHKHGMKVTGHICSISFTEAVELGIDNIEHGLLTNSDYDPGKERSECPPTFMQHAAQVDLDGPEVERTFRMMIDNDVPMTSTLAVYELFVPNRPTKDARTLEAMAPEVREDYLEARKQIDESGNGIDEDFFLKAMAYERRFVEMGGLLASGVDPTGNGGALPGFGDQRNFELLREAGFSPEQTVQIMSANGAKILDEDGRLGTVESGMVADMVLMQGDLTQDPSVIRNVVTVFKDGIGYDSVKLLDDVKGRVGIR